MSSRIHHTELSQNERMGIVLGWVSLALLVVGLLGYAGNNFSNLSCKEKGLGER